MTGWSGAAVLALLVAAWLGETSALLILGAAGVLAGLWVLFALFTFYFFRDPDPMAPTGANSSSRPATARWTRSTRRPNRNSWAANASASPFFFP